MPRLLNKYIKLFPVVVVVVVVDLLLLRWIGR